MSSTAAPAGQATTGVPHAIASMITNPNGSGHWTGNTMARARPSRSTLTSWLTASSTSTLSLIRGATTSSQYDSSNGSLRLTIIVSDNPARRVDLNRLDGPLVWVRASDIDEKIILVFDEGIGSEVDPVVHHPRVADLGIVAILRVANCYEVDAVLQERVVAPALLGPWTVQRVHDGRMAPKERAERWPHDAGVVMNYVDVGRRDVRRVRVRCINPHVANQARVRPVVQWRHESGLRARARRREEGHVVAPLDEAVGEKRYDKLDTPISLGRNREPRGRDLGNPHTTCSRRRAP